MDSLRYYMQLVETEQDKFPTDYMGGHCHVFAAALHRAYGFSFLVLTGP